MPKEPFTQEEKEVMDLILEAHDKFCKLNKMDPDDTKDWINGIHKCQNVIMLRVVARDYPDVFYAG